MTLLAWSGVVAVLFFSEVPRLFTWIGAAFDLLLLHGTLDLFFLASRIDVQKGELILRRGRFGREKARRFAADEIAKIEATPGMQWRGRLLYNLRLVKPNGRDRTLARHLPDLETAELLARELEAVLL